jgi:hypothetical protein
MGIRVSLVNGELVPSHRELRMSDADRERVVNRLNAAVAEGRLTLAEFEERVDGVLRARTYGEIEPYVADLPTLAGGAVAPARDTIELRNHASTLKRTGRWAVPRRIAVHSNAGSVKLDFRQAVIAHRVVEIDLRVVAGSVTIVVPPGATADIDAVDTFAGESKSKVPSVPEPSYDSTHFVVSGTQKAGSVIVRYERRFLRWTW